MAISFFQKLKLGFRGWNRRQGESAAKRNAEFLQRSSTWAKAPEPQLRETEKAVERRVVDLEGLQVAYLDNSGKLEHYLDLETGEVREIESSNALARSEVAAAANRYRRVPQRTPASEARDREMFASTVDKPAMREALEAAVSSADPAGEFRRALAQDRSAERAWYNFKNDRAAEEIERWLEGLLR